MSEKSVKCDMLLIPDNVMLMFPSPINVEFSSLPGRMLATFMEIFPVANIDLVSEMPSTENWRRMDILYQFYTGP